MSERIAYEELQPGTEVQAGDQYRNTQGRWVEYSLDTSGVPIVGPTAMARRPHNITQMLAEFANQAEVLAEVRADEKRLVDNLELLRSEYLKLQSERDELRVEIQNLLKTITDNADQFADAGKILEQERDELQTALIESRLWQQRKVAEVMEVCKERDEACTERDLARSEVARLSTELWARKPLEDRVASLTEELAQARENIQKLVKTNADNADQFAEHTKFLVHERDEARAEAQRLQEVVRTLHSEPMAWQVQQMLGTWITELNWSVGCFGSFGRAQVDIIQQTMTAVIQRIETMIHPEGNTNRDEARAEVRRVQEVVCNLYGEPTAKQVQDMLRTWITAVDWSAGCFDSNGREQIDTIQKTLIAVMERIDILNPEDNTDGE